MGSFYKSNLDLGHRLILNFPVRISFDLKDFISSINSSSLRETIGTFMVNALFF